MKNNQLKQSKCKCGKVKSAVEPMCSSCKVFAAKVAKNKKGKK